MSVERIHIPLQFFLTQCFGMKLENNLKPWAPHKAFSVRVLDLRMFSKGKINILIWYPIVIKGTSNPTYDCLYAHVLLVVTILKTVTHTNLLQLYGLFHKVHKFLKLFYKTDFKTLLISIQIMLLLMIFCVI